jgi:hypothetical protein
MSDIYGRSISYPDSKYCSIYRYGSSRVKAMQSSPLLKPFKMEVPYPVENIDRFYSLQFQTSDNTGWPISI